MPLHSSLGDRVRLCFKKKKKVNSKWIQDLNLKDKTIQFLDKNVGINLCDLGISNGYMTPKGQAIKEIIIN